MSLNLETDIYCPLRAAHPEGKILTVPHDKGIYRALKSQYKIDQKGNSEDSEDTNAKETEESQSLSKKKLKHLKLEKSKRTIFVWDLSPKVKNVDLEKVFSEFGPVESARVIRDIVTRISKCYGFVTFVKQKHALRATKGKGLHINGKTIECQMEVCRLLKGWRPRRLGGGFGGRIGSGQMRFGGKNCPFKTSKTLTL